MGGKFLSQFGYINRLHPHDWDFVDRPLIYELTFGDHGLNDKGIQLTWLAPTPFHLLFGVEGFQGENERSFNYVGKGSLPRRAGPRVGAGWIKLSPDLGPRHGLQAGLFGGRGVHQEAHDGDGDGAEDHWLHGHTLFFGGDLVYKYDAPKAHGEGDLVLQAEYMFRTRSLEVEAHSLNAALIGRKKKEWQDGFYAQAVYGIFPRWRAGLRGDVVGLTNRVELPPGDSHNFDNTYRLSAMVDFTPSEFSRLRAQLSRGEYQTDEGREPGWELFLQLQVSLGTHGAHKF
jgi:outer membrane receptor protein involved in Fe transport